jgi:DNA repair protein RecO (recombination protein O)
MHRTGLEPVTTRFEAGYSIRLSYRCLILLRNPAFLTKSLFFYKTYELKPLINNFLSMTSEKTEGIVLRSLDYQDHQRILTVFTESHGMISLITKNISQRHPSFLTITTPFCQAEFLYVKKQSDLYRLRDSTVLDEHLSLRNQFAYLQTAGCLVQALLQSQLPGKPAPQLYTLFSSYLKHIPSNENPYSITASFLLKILHHEGLVNLKDACAVCGQVPALYLNQGECVCNIHASSCSIFLLPEEKPLMQELMFARSFKKLSTLTTNLLLNQKIQTYFTRRIKQNE